MKKLLSITLAAIMFTSCTKDELQKTDYGPVATHMDLHDIVGLKFGATTARITRGDVLMKGIFSYNSDDFTNPLPHTSIAVVHDTKGMPGEVYFGDLLIKVTLSGVKVKDHVYTGTGVWETTNRTGTFIDFLVLGTGKLSYEFLNYSADPKQDLTDEYIMVLDGYSTK